MNWRAAVLAIAVLLGSALASEAAGRDFHGHPGSHGQFQGGPRHFGGGGGPRVFIGVGPVWPSPWWYYPQPYYVYAPPPVVVQAPPVYVEAAPLPSPPQYWYLCPSFNAYYPQVQTCPEPWLTVPARAY